jgi:hypothetical protein
MSSSIERNVEAAKARSIEDALRLIRSLRRPLPPGFKFDRLEANVREQRDPSAS